MAYCTLEELKRRLSLAELVQLTDDEGLGQVDQLLVEAVIDESDSLIDSYLAVQTEVPLTQPPERVRALSADLSLFRLFLRRGGSVPDEVKESYRRSLADLVAYAKGELPLFAPSDKSAPRQVRLASGNADFDADQWQRF